MRSYGLAGMQNHIRSTIALGKMFSELLLTRPDLFKLFVEPAFALTVFTVKGPEDTTKRVYEKIEKEKKMFPSGAVVGGTYVIRVVSGLPGLTEQHIKEAFEIVVKAAEEIIAEVSPGEYTKSK